MRKLWLLAMIIFLSTLAGELFAQTTQDVYYQSIPVIKVLKHRLGYKVFYIKNDMKIAAAYIPLRWMKTAGGKAEIVWGKDPAYPYMTVYWLDNKFAHVRLYVKPVNDVSWGVLEVKEEEIRDFFNIEELKLDF